ncbi:tRNA 2-thiouridine(34) synthase MnmA [bacterium Unc6]|nr:tRNA 2-thiouridine(34) synthase MnmA [bacterium Unc6]
MNIVVALSGGVDSSVAAAQLCKKQNRVIGITMRLWPDWLCGTQHQRSCCGLQSIQDARLVAEKLNIPFYVLNMGKEFEKEVIVPFCEEYLKGRTPNPCILCNEKLKFDRLLKKAKQLDCDYIATGHYANVSKDTETGRFVLSCGKDKKKDQSYVLFSLTQGQLAHSIFPNASFTKKQVRSIAKKLGLPIYNKKESMEICFAGEGKYQDVVKHYYSSAGRQGNITDTKGQVLGKHMGIENWTIGQRKGLGIAKEKPVYVVRIEPEHNKIVVGPREILCKKELFAKNINWVSIEKPDKVIKCKAKVRSAHPASSCTVEVVDNKLAKVVFSRKQFAITPGQAVVFYKNGIVLGGGWIE